MEIKINAPICTIDGHVRFHEAINPNPLVFRCIAIKGDLSMFADKTATAVRANDEFAAQRHRLLSLCIHKMRCHTVGI
jgi:hypothetical protein